MVIKHELPLSQVPTGKKARVTNLVFKGAARRRLLDLGIIEGTKIEKLYPSPSGNPAAYLIRGAVIALRTDITSQIMVSAVLKDKQRKAVQWLLLR